MDRYLITTEPYIYADRDQKAKSLANYIQGKQRKVYDNQCHVTKLQSAPFGRFGSDTNLMDDDA